MYLAKLSEKLTTNKFIPWRLRYLGGPINTIIGAPLRRYRLLKKINKSIIHRQDDITLIIGIKGRLNYRLENCLKSIKLQSYPADLIKTVIVDYDNDPEEATKLKELAGKYDAKVIRVENRPIWNKPHCLNVAIRQAETKYTMPIDADIILSENYLEKTIQTLKSHPLSIVLSEMLDLPEESTKILENYAKTDLKISDVELLKNKTTVRKTHTQLPEHNNIHISLHATYTFIYHEIRGYDEYYTLWGSEDNDMYRRLTYVGLTPISIGNEAYYMHQWHKKHESINSSNLGQVIKNNHIYYENNHSIARNENSWGANHD